MFSSTLRRWLVLGAVCAFCGCGEPKPDWKSTYPVTGRVLVDGEPAENLAVYCISLSAPDKEHPTRSECLTHKDGTFEIGTYLSNDGVPEGEYALTFQWGEIGGISFRYEGDKLNGRYTDPKNSPVKFTVEAGEPTDLGTIELTTK